MAAVTSCRRTKTSPGRRSYYCRRCRSDVWGWSSSIDSRNVNCDPGHIQCHTKQPPSHFVEAARRTAQLEQRHTFLARQDCRCPRKVWGCLGGILLPSTHSHRNASLPRFADRPSRHDKTPYRYRSLQQVPQADVPCVLLYLFVPQPGRLEVYQQSASHHKTERYLRKTPNADGGS